MNKGIFLSIKDLMNLTGSSSYDSTARQHRSIRDSLGKTDGKITIKEYCDYEKIDFKHVWEFLREEK